MSAASDPDVDRMLSDYKGEVRASPDRRAFRRLPCCDVDLDVCTRATPNRRRIHADHSHNNAKFDQTWLRAMSHASTSLLHRWR